ALAGQQRLGGSRSFTRLPRYASVAAARGALEREQVIGILVLPSAFSADLSAGRPASAQLLLDGRRSNAAQITAQYVSTIMAAEGAPLSGAPPQARTGGAGPAPPPNAEVVIDNWFNPNLEYQWFMMPNLVGMLSLAVALPLALLSGFATPVENMPWWLQFVTTINPLAHMLRLMQGLFLKGASVASMAQDLVKLLEIALCTTAAAVLLFRRKAA